LRLQIYLAEDERQALQRLAISEMRSLREQVRFVIREDLSRRGLLSPDPECAQEAQAVHAEQGGKNA
jgi:hypothetical protein